MYNAHYTIYTNVQCTLHNIHECTMYITQYTRMYNVPSTIYTNVQRTLHNIHECTTCITQYTRMYIT